MLDQVRVLNLQGHLHQLKGNEPILLDDLQMWVVQSGSVALFAVTAKDGVLEGNRHFLFRCGSKQALFGTASRDHRRILAVPLGETTLLKVNLEHLEELVAEANPRVISLIEGWVQQLGTALAYTPMSVQVKAVGEASFSLIAGETFQLEPGKIAWVQIQAGTVRWLGLPELTLTSTEGPVPFSNQMWLEAEDLVQLTTQTTFTFRKLNILLKGLSQLHTRILHYIDLLVQREDQAEQQRLQERDRLNRQVTAAALGDLASVLSTREAEHFLEGDPLLVAAGAVGKALGIAIRPPASSENPRRAQEPLEAIARASRVRMRRVLLRDNWWEQDCGPLIAYTQTEQPVALLPVSTNCYEIFDPVERSRTTADNSSSEKLAPTAYMFYRPLPDKVLKAIDLFRFAFKGRLRDLLIVLLTGITAALLGMLTPQATAIVIDSAIPDSDRGLLLQIGLGLLAVAFGTALFRLAQGFALLRVEMSSDASTQAAVWDRLLNLPVSFFCGYKTGDLLSRVLSVSAIRRQLSGTTMNTLLTSLFALLNLGLLFYYSVKLALVAAAVALVTFTVTLVAGVLIIRKVHPLLEMQGNIFGQTVQLINGISKLRVAGAEERAFAAWSKNYSQQVRLDLSTQHIEDAVALFNTVMPTLTSAVLFWFTLKLLTEAQTVGGIGLSVGTFLAFNTAFSTFIKGATDLSNTATSALQVVPQWKRAQPILETRPEVNLSKVDPGTLTGRITFAHVTFRYRNDGPQTLDDVSIRAEPGEFVALVGASGSGKSTLLRLLLGFETPNSGTIYYDGQDLSGLNVDAVRRQLGVVLQTGRITSASIFDNITSGAQLTLDEAWEAACMAGLAEDIAMMPMGMHTVISEGGGNLSGGQRQRLLIARALALKPRILLFDEATSALDNRTQAIVSESLDRLQVTRVVVAHRLSTIHNAHRIYVLQAGRIVQQGSFETLANQEGMFAQLMARQIA